MLSRFRPWRISIGIEYVICWFIVIMFPFAHHPMIYEQGDNSVQCLCNNSISIWLQFGRFWAWTIVFNVFCVELLQTASGWLRKMVSGLINANPIVYEKKEHRTRTAPNDVDKYDVEPIDQLEIFDILRVWLLHLMLCHIHCVLSVIYLTNRRFLCKAWCWY